VVFVIELNLLAGREEEFVEEARLLYVGMTRATHELHLSARAAGAFVEAVDGAISKL
jgi:superfamily I DNA/RNA helicase